MKMAPDTSSPRRDRATYIAAAKFVGAFVVIALVVFFGALIWLSGCKTGSGQGALEHCSGVQRNTLAIGPAVILAVGGVWAFVRTYQTWRAYGGWWIWQGAGWFLLMLMLIVLGMTAPMALL